MIAALDPLALLVTGELGASPHLTLRALARSRPSPVWRKARISASYHAVDVDLIAATTLADVAAEDAPRLGIATFASFTCQ
jgi:hypothetical protein